MKKNYFIAFEGIDGSGKSTQVKLLSEKLQQEGHKVYTTSEPTSNPIGTLIRSIFKGKLEADHKTIAALYLADRLEHLLNKTDGILKKMEEGFTVVTDRYYFSSYAYHGTHMSLDWVIEANSICADLLRPDMTIFVDVPPEVCMKRLSEDREMMELYETLDNLNKVREKYFESFEKLSGEEAIFITNGDRPLDAIFTDVWNEIERMHKAHKSYS